MPPSLKDWALIASAPTLDSLCLQLGNGYFSSSWTTPSSPLNEDGKRRERKETSSSVRLTGAIAVLVGRLVGGGKSPGMGQVWSCHPTASSGQSGKQAPSLREGAGKNSSSVKSPVKQTEELELGSRSVGQQSARRETEAGNLLSMLGQPRGLHAGF